MGYASFLYRVYKSLLVNNEVVDHGKRGVDKVEKKEEITKNDVAIC